MTPRAVPERGKAGSNSTKATTSPRRMLVATLGHVDHGKTSLLRALTGVDTDRLPDEKRRGISIELGFAELAGADLSFIDVPGHKKLVHTMIAGLGGVDVGLLVVAADDGVMPQTREHLQICRLAGVHRLIVALSKSDLVDDELLELARLDVEASLMDLGFSEPHIIPTDIINNRGLGELRAALLTQRPKATRRPKDAPIWLAVDRVFSVKGAGTVITGTLTRGKLTRDAELRLLGRSDMGAVRCRGLEVHGRAVEALHAPSRVALNLVLAHGQTIERGDALVDRAYGVSSRRFDVALSVLEGAEPELANGASVLCHVGASHRQARLTWLRPPEPDANGLLHGYGHLATEAKLAVQPGIPLLLRGFRTDKYRGSVLAGGVVLDGRAAALPRRRASVRGGEALLWACRATALQALEAGQFGTATEYLLLSTAPRPAALTELSSRLGTSPAQLERAVGSNPQLKTIGSAVCTQHGLDHLEGLLIDSVDEHHAATPHELGLPREAAVARLARLSSKTVAEWVVATSIAAGTLVETSGKLATPAFSRTGGAAVEHNRALVSEALARRGLQGATERELWTELDLDANVVRTALSELGRRDDARALTGLWFSALALQELRTTVERHFARNALLSLADLKGLAGVSRKQAVPLMEYLDRTRVTRRVGNDRVPYGNA